MWTGVKYNPYRSSNTPSLFICFIKSGVSPAYPGLNQEKIIYISIFIVHLLSSNSVLIYLWEKCQTRGLPEDSVN